MPGKTSRWRVWGSESGERSFRIRVTKLLLPVSLQSMSTQHHYEALRKARIIERAREAKQRQQMNRELKEKENPSAQSSSVAATGDSEVDGKTVTVKQTSKNQGTQTVASCFN